MGADHASPDLNITFTSTSFPCLLFMSSQSHAIYRWPFFFGWISHSPATQIALPGQLKVTFEDLRWDVKCRADGALMRRFEPLVTDHWKKIRDEVTE